VNAITATLSIALLFGATPNRVPQERTSQDQSSQEQTNETQPVDQVEVRKTTGTIQKVDPNKRKLTIRLDDGSTKTLTVDKTVKDLDEFKPGDRVQVSYTEEIVMAADRSDDTRAVAKYGYADVMEGDNPALVKVDTTVVAGKILAIDPKKRRVVIEDPDGKKRALKLSKKVKNLDQFKPGETLNMAITDEMAVEVMR
jgi:Cu/Ag efflux protein CusF